MNDDYYYYYYDGDFFIYTSKSNKNKKKNTKYINDTAGSMLCHISPAAYTYKGSFTL